MMHVGDTMRTLGDIMSTSGMFSTFGVFSTSGFSIEIEKLLPTCSPTCSMISPDVKSVQSALSDLLTTSATHGTFFRPSTKRGLILIGLELNANARELFEHC